LEKSFLVAESKSWCPFKKSRPSEKTKKFSKIKNNKIGAWDC
jgi:hypothetical protein